MGFRKFQKVLEGEEMWLGLGGRKEYYLLNRGFCLFFVCMVFILYLLKWYEFLEDGFIVF